MFFYFWILNLINLIKCYCLLNWGFTCKIICNVNVTSWLIRVYHHPERAGIGSSKKPHNPIKGMDKAVTDSGWMDGWTSSPATPRDELPPCAIISSAACIINMWQSLLSYYLGPGRLTDTLRHGVMLKTKQ